ncbi:hypothetical protein KZ773_02125 [Escherichia coli]|nr:hypothetical protein [Escherichia coli]
MASQTEKLSPGDCPAEENLIWNESQNREDYISGNISGQSATLNGRKTLRVEQLDDQPDFN